MNSHLIANPMNPDWNAQTPENKGDSYLIANPMKPPQIAQPTENKGDSYLSVCPKTQGRREMTGNFQPLEISAAVRSSPWKTPAEQEAAP